MADDERAIAAWTHDHRAEDPARAAKLDREYKDSLLPETLSKAPKDIRAEVGCYNTSNRGNAALRATIEQLSSPQLRALSEVTWEGKTVVQHLESLIAGLEHSNQVNDEVAAVTRALTQLCGDYVDVTGGSDERDRFIAALDHVKEACARRDTHEKDGEYDTADFFQDQLNHPGSGFRTVAKSVMAELARVDANAEHDDGRCAALTCGAVTITTSTAIADQVAVLRAAKDLIETDVVQLAKAEIAAKSRLDVYAAFLAQREQLQRELEAACARRADQIINGARSSSAFDVHVFGGTVELGLVAAAKADVQLRRVKAAAAFDLDCQRRGHAQHTAAFKAAKTTAAEHKRIIGELMDMYAADNAVLSELNAVVCATTASLMDAYSRRRAAGCTSSSVYQTEILKVGKAIVDIGIAELEKTLEKTTNRKIRVNNTVEATRLAEKMAYLEGLDAEEKLSAKAARKAAEDELIKVNGVLTKAEADLDNWIAVHDYDGLVKRLRTACPLAGVDDVRAEARKRRESRSEQYLELVKKATGSLRRMIAWS